MTDDHHAVHERQRRAKRTMAVVTVASALLVLGTGVQQLAVHGWEVFRERPGGEEEAVEDVAAPAAPPRDATAEPPPTDGDRLSRRRRGPAVSRPEPRAGGPTWTASRSTTSRRPTRPASPIRMRPSRS